MCLYGSLCVQKKISRVEEGTVHTTLLSGGTIANEVLPRRGYCLLKTTTPTHWPVAYTTNYLSTRPLT